MIGQTSIEQKKKIFNLFCQSLLTHQLFFAKWKLGTPSRCERGKHPKLKGDITLMAEAQKEVKNLQLAFSCSVIVSSAGVIYVSSYRVISEGRNGERRNYFSLQTENR